ncbi:MAG: hypothetical protein KF760_19905 [Candidatus Eremiobacteraeota bacterium]|nr:hypothetical protein [Candidatus Eremiobacteraeota bacterium]
MITAEQLPDEESSSQGWQPAYVLYGGAQLFSAETHDKMLGLARRWLKEYAWLNDTTKKRVEKRLAQPLDDLRIDFEDGYGRRPDEEEDAHALKVAQALPQVHEPRRCGIRIKPVTRRFAARGLRTLEIALQNLTVWPRGFCVTLPKLEEPAQVRFVIQELERIEKGRPPLPLELMIESPAGLRRVHELVQAAGERGRGVHFGPFDFLASCGIGHGDLLHPVNRQARAQLLLAVSGTGLELADGPTTLLPLPPHKQPAGPQIAENQKSVRLAWEFHRDQVLATREQGYFQSWLLHPAQLVSHTAALLQENEKALPGALERLTAYWRGRGQARASGGDFDDRATARQWTRIVAQAVELGLMDESGLPPEWRQV